MFHDEWLLEVTFLVIIEHEGNVFMEPHIKLLVHNYIECHSFILWRWGVFYSWSSLIFKDTMSPFQPTSNYVEPSTKFVFWGAQRGWVISPIRPIFIFLKVKLTLPLKKKLKKKIPPFVNTWNTDKGCL